jgi:hypothetical protein
MNDQWISDRVAITDLERVIKHLLKGPSNVEFLGSLFSEEKH